MKRLIVSALAFALTSSVASSASAKFLRAPEALKGRYIVTLKNVSPEAVDAVAATLAGQFQGRLLGTLKSGMQGFGISLTEAQAIALSHQPQVELVEEDSLGHASDEPAKFAFRNASPGRETKKIPPTGFLPHLLSVPAACPWLGSYYRCEFTDDTYWALDRLDNLGLVVPYDPNNPNPEAKSYRFATTGLGSGSYTDPVRAYVIDTGIYGSHVEFDSPSRVETGANMIIDTDVWDTQTRQDEELPLSIIADDYANPNNPCGSWRATDRDVVTHGTAVGSVIGGTNTGVAKNVRLVPVKVSTCGGQFAKLAVARGLDWVIHDMTCPNYPFGQEPPNKTGCVARSARGVINMSLYFNLDAVNGNGYRNDAQVCEDGAGGYVNCVAALENEINQAIANNLPVVVSANNYSTNMCSNQTPARMGQYSNASTWSGPFASTYHTITVGGTMATATTGYTDQRWTCEAAPELCDRDWASPTTTEGHGSNYGDCVSIFAPAWNIRVASGTGSSNYRASGGPSSGTSFSAAYVTGVVARLLQLNPNLTPLDVWNSLVFRANQRCQPGGVCPSSFDPSRTNQSLVYMAPSE